MSYLQAVEESQYSEAARFDRFDGFDRGDLDNTDADLRDQGSECIGRMAGEWEGGGVEVLRLWDGDHEFFQVVVYFADREPSVYSDGLDTAEQAKACGRWWLNGCPA